MEQRSTSSEQKTRDELRDELLAIMAARHELSMEHEEHLAAAFLERLDRHIEARFGTAGPAPSKKKDRTDVMTIALVFAIPLSAIAGGIAGLTGLLLAWAAILAVVYMVTRD